MGRSSASSVAITKAWTAADIPTASRAIRSGLPLRCLTIADIYDALTSDRAYRKALARRGGPQDHARGGGVGMWDKRLIDTFAAVVVKARVASPPTGVSPVSSP